MGVFVDERLSMDFNTETVTKSPFVIGMLGAIVALRGAPGSTWRERLFNVISGTLLAGFFSPAITEYFSVETPAIQAAAAFAVGLFGLNLTAALLEQIKGAKFSLPFTREK